MLISWFISSSMCAGLLLVFLGVLLLLSRLSAEAAKIRYDLNLLWTNKFDRSAGLPLCFLQPEALQICVRRN